MVHENRSSAGSFFCRPPWDKLFFYVTTGFGFDSGKRENKNKHMMEHFKLWYRTFRYQYKNDPGELFFEKVFSIEFLQ